MRHVCVAQILNRRHVLPCPFGLHGILQASQASSVSQLGQWCLQMGCDQTSSSCGASVTSSLVHLLGSARSTSVSVGLTTDGPWCLRTCCSHTSCSARAVFFVGRGFSVALAMPSTRRLLQHCRPGCQRRARSGDASTSPALVASRRMSLIRLLSSLAGTTARRCAARATATDLRQPIPAKPAPSVACCALSSDHPGKASPVTPALLRRRSGLMCPCHSKDAIDPSDSQAFTSEGELGLWSVAQLNELMHCSSDVCFCHELVCDVLSRPHCDSQGRIAVCCRGDSGQSADVSDSPSGSALSRSGTL